MKSPQRSTLKGTGGGKGTGPGTRQAKGRSPGQVERSGTKPRPKERKLKGRKRLRPRQRKNKRHRKRSSINASQGTDTAAGGGQDGRRGKRPARKMLLQRARVWKLCRRQHKRDRAGRQISREDAYLLLRDWIFEYR